MVECIGYDVIISSARQRHVDGTPDRAIMTDTRTSHLIVSSYAPFLILLVVCPLN